MKKSLIALTVASFAASTAYAQLDLDDPMATGSSVYASEIDVSGTGIEVAAAESVQASLGFTVTDAAPRFVRFDLTDGGNFVGSPTLAFSNLGTAATPNSILSSGGDGESFVLFEINATTATPVPNDAIVTLNFAGTPPNLGLAGTTQISYTLYEFGAGGGNGELASAGPNTLAQFSPAIEVGTTGVTGGAAMTPVESPRLIEVADDSLNFEGGGVDTALGTIFVADTADVPTPLLATGGPASITDILSSHTIMITGDFSAAEDVTLVVDAGGAICGVTAPLLSATINSDMNEAVFAPPAVGQVGLLSSDGVEAAATVCLEVTGEDVIEEGSYAGVYMPVAASGFTVGDTPFTLGSLGNTGTTITLNLTLTPRTEGGSYANFFRVTNPTNTEGRVFIRLINDLGESSATIDMIDVYGDTNTVPGQGSSRQFDINDVYAAVQAADPSFSIPEDGPLRKLRTVITGEFGDMDVQTYTVSTDATTFSTF